MEMQNICGFTVVLKTQLILSILLQISGYGMVQVDPGKCMNPNDNGVLVDCIVELFQS